MSHSVADDAVQERVSGADFHTKILTELKKKELGIDLEEQAEISAAKKRKRNKKKEPNPLSCKKKKKKPNSPNNKQGSEKSEKGHLNKTQDKLVSAGKKRKRNRKKARGGAPGPTQPPTASWDQNANWCLCFLGSDEIKESSVLYLALKNRAV